MSRLFFENLLPGTLLFYRFELVRCLDSTELGGIYLCRDRELGGRTTVIKIVSALAERCTGLNLRRELTLSQTVHHPNVLSGREFFRDDDFIAYSMEFAESGSLAEKLLAGALSLGTAVAYGIQVARGLEALHGAGILHRDLKPQNVLITSSGRAMITDFGIAIHHGEQRDPNHADRISGTMNYLAPEYLVDGVYTERSDIYSFGVLMYEMLTGRMPFRGNSLIETLQQRVRFDAPPPHYLVPEIPKGVSEIVLSAMSRSPKFRPSSARDLRIELEHFADLYSPLPGQEAA